MPSRPPIGQRVREQRRSLRLTQQDLSDLSGVATRTIHDIEHDKPTIRLDVLQDVLTVLGLEISLKLRTANPASNSASVTPDTPPPTEAP